MTEAEMLADNVEQLRRIWENYAGEYPAKRSPYADAYAVPMLERAIRRLEGVESLEGGIVPVRATFTGMPGPDTDLGRTWLAIGAEWRLLLSWVEYGLEAEGIVLRGTVGGERFEHRLMLFPEWSENTKRVQGISGVKMFPIPVGFGEEAGVGAGFKGERKGPLKLVMPEKYLESTDMELAIISGGGEVSGFIPVFFLADYREL